MAANDIDQSTLFQGEAHADLYLKFRPVFPSKVFENILKYLEEKTSKPFKLAVDVGCGSGQSSRPLTPYFEKVIGVDVSEAMLAKATQHPSTPPNLEYRVGAGEKIPVLDNSVSLVTCSVAVHWFDYEQFLAEVDRVLVPSGCLAIYTYGCIEPQACDGDEIKNEELKKLLTRLYNKTLRPYWAPGIKHIENMYADFNVPYAESLRDESIKLKQKTTVTSCTGFLRSWSAARKYIEMNPGAPDPLDEYQEGLMAILDRDGKSTPDQCEVLMTGAIALILGRKPALMD